jgi:Holliday junction DNA helicase RuvA
MAVPGIGRKGAERLVLDLRDRIGAVESSGHAAADDTGVAATAPWRDQLERALAGLGFTGREAGQALDTIAGEVGADDNPDLSTLLRRGIQLLGRSG